MYPRSIIYFRFVTVRIGVIWRGLGGGGNVPPIIFLPRNKFFGY